MLSQRVICIVYLKVLLGGQLFAVELVLYVGHLEAAQHRGHLGARAQILVQLLQRPEILLGAALANVQQLRVHLLQALVVELLAQDAELALEVGCTGCCWISSMKGGGGRTNRNKLHKCVSLPRLSMHSFRLRSHSLSSISDESSESGSSASSPLESRSGPAPPRLEPDRCDSAPDMSSSLSLFAAVAMLLVTAAKGIALPLAIALTDEGIDAAAAAVADDIEVDVMVLLALMMLAAAAAAPTDPTIVVASAEAPVESGAVAMSAAMPSAPSCVVMTPSGVVVAATTVFMDGIAALPANTQFLPRVWVARSVSGRERGTLDGKGASHRRLCRLHGLLRERCGVGALDWLPERRGAREFRGA